MLLRPLANAVVKLVVVTAETEIHLPIPVKVILGTGLREPLHGIMSTAIDRVNRSFGVVVDVVGERLRVVHAHLLLRPQSSHAPEFLGQVVFDDLLVNLFRGPYWEAIVLDVKQEMHIILAYVFSRFELKLGGDGQSSIS